VKEIVYIERFEVLTVVSIKVMVSSDVTPSRLVNRYQCFGNYCISLKGRDIMIL
jgi:hypothetical protein